MTEQKTKHTWTKWMYCDEFIGEKYSRVCKVCKCIQFSNNPCGEKE
jgi:hypothetical protein